MSSLPPSRVARPYPCRLGIVAPRIDPYFGGFSFNQKDIQSLQHVEYLRRNAA
jgi:hypothetical protein